MKCYNHQDRDSVAICRTCGRAVCHECSRECETGITCRRQCCDSLLEQERLLKELAAHLKSVRRSNLLGSLFSLGMGGLFIFFSQLGFGPVYNFVFLLGTGFTIYGAVALLVYLLIFFKHRRMQTVKKNTD